jgi:hypothetical protein
MTSDDFERQIMEEVERVSQPKGEHKVHEERVNGKGSTQLLPSPQVPMDVARLFVAKCCTYDGILTLRH